MLRTLYRVAIDAVAVCTCFFLVGCVADKSVADNGDDRRVLSSKFVEKSGETNAVTLRANLNLINHCNSPVFIEFILQNNRNTSIWLNHSQTAGDIFMRLSRLGEPVPFTDFGGKHISGDAYEFTHNLRILLLPGAIMNWKYNLQDYFQITEPGLYSLTALRTVDGTKADPFGGGLFDEVDLGPIYFYINK